MSTAAHCSTDLTSENAGGGGETTLNFQGAHEGTWGDVQWHKSSATISDNFYVDYGVSRDAQATDFATEGETICHFGRKSGKSCDDVYQLNHCEGDVCYLTAMHNDKSQGGDSGRPYFYNNTVYGIHHGYKWWNLKSRDVFMPVRYFDEALGLHVALN